VVETKKPLVVPAVLVAGVVLFTLRDTVVSTADAGTPNSMVTSSIANNPSTTAGIAIIMATPPDEQIRNFEKS
jgi:hypothetical protein